MLPSRTSNHPGPQPNHPSSPPNHPSSPPNHPSSPPKGAKRKHRSDTKEASEAKEQAKLRRTLERVGLKRNVWHVGWRQKYSCGRFNETYCCLFTDDGHLHVQAYETRNVQFVDPIRSVAKYGPPDAVTNTPLTKGLYKLAVRTPKPRYDGEAAQPLLYVTAATKLHPACPPDVDQYFPGWRPRGSDACLYCDWGRPDHPIKISRSIAERFEDHRSCD